MNQFKSFPIFASLLLCLFSCQSEKGPSKTEAAKPQTESEETPQKTPTADAKSQETPQKTPEAEVKEEAKPQIYGDCIGQENCNFDSLQKCEHHSDCPKDTLCRMGLTELGYQLACFYDDGTPVSESVHPFFCASGSVYVDQGIRKCAYGTGQSCSDQPEKCGQTGLCIDGICKKKQGFSCSTHTECAEGICDLTRGIDGTMYEADDEKTVCIGPTKDNGGEILPEPYGDQFCQSGSSYIDKDGQRRCKSLFGADCSKDQEVCLSNCEKGICKQELFDPCDKDLECPKNMICNFGNCRLLPGEILAEGMDIASCARPVDESVATVFTDGDLKRCSFPTGADCSENSEICHGVCDLGVCKIPLREDCEESRDCPHDAVCDQVCYLKEGALLPEEEDEYSCLSHSSYKDGDVTRCTWIEGADCRKNPKICDGSCVKGKCVLSRERREQAKELAAEQDYYEWVNAGRNYGPDCFDWQIKVEENCFNPGDSVMPEEDEKRMCLSGKVYRKKGEWRCLHFAGDPCKKNPKICGGICEAGICKQKLMDRCFKDSDCAEGLQCVPCGGFDDDIENLFLHCRLKGDGVLPKEGSEALCASGEAYVDQEGNKRCKGRSGDDCSLNKELCAGVCDQGICRRKPGEGCTDQAECAKGSVCDKVTETCLLEGGELLPEENFQKKTDPETGKEIGPESLCRSGSYYIEQGQKKCSYLFGGDCSKDSDICSHKHSLCIDGSCKRLPGVSGGYCEKDDECAFGAQCGCDTEDCEISPFMPYWNPLDKNPRCRLK